MKHFLLLFFLVTQISLFAQEKVWTTPTDDVNFMSQLDDGKLLLKNKSKIFLVNHKTGLIEFEHEIKTKEQPELLEDLPIFFFEGSPFTMIDYASGTVIDESNEKTTILGVTYFWEKRRVVVEMKRNNELHILNLNLKDISTSWTTSVGKVNKKVVDPIYRISELPPYITLDNKLVIYDQKSVSILHQNGNLIKQLNLKNKIKSHYVNDKKGMVYVLDSKNRLHFIDTQSETNSFIALNDDNIDLKVLGDGSTISFLQGKKISIVDAISGKLIGENFMLENIKMSYIDEASGRLYVVTRRELVEIDKASGAAIKKVSFAKDMKEIRKVFDKTVINGNSWASPIDLNTLQLEYPQLPNIPAIHDYVELDNAIGYIYENDTRYEFHVVDESGNVLWDEGFHSTISPSFDVIDQGVLMINDSRVKYLYAKNGVSLWHEKVKVGNAFTYGIDEETNDLYMYSGKRLFRFDHSNGTLAKSEDKFRFRDFDYEFQTPQLFVLDDAIFLKGSNSIFVLNKDGTLKHKKSYKRISSGSTVLDVINIAVVAIAIGTGNIDELAYGPSDNGIYVGSLVDPLDLSASIADDMRFDRREKQNRGSNVYPYVFTYIKVGQRGFIFLDPSTGEERFNIPVESKSPNYIVDEYDGMLFHLKENELIGYDVK